MKNKFECFGKLFLGETLVNITSGEKIKYHQDSGQIIRLSDDKAIEPDFLCPDVWHVSRETKIEFIERNENGFIEAFSVVDKINEIIEVVNRLNERFK